MNNILSNEHNYIQAKTQVKITMSYFTASENFPLDAVMKF